MHTSAENTSCFRRLAHLVASTTSRRRSRCSGVYRYLYRTCTKNKPNDVVTVGERVNNPFLNLGVGICSSTERLSVLLWIVHCLARTCQYIVYVRYIQ